MIDPASWDVYLVTDRSLSKGRTTLKIVEAAINGGISVVQLREKDLSTRLFLEEGLLIRDLLRSQNIPLIINDRLDIALALDADGLHVGAGDMPIKIARKLLGPNKIVGLSINELSEINQEATECADYFGISPVFSTSTKLDLMAPWELDGVQKARELTEIPLVGIGGIHAGNAREVIQAGAHCVAVVSAIVSADDPEAATRDIVGQVRVGKFERRG